ncbi:MAG TPA: mechanosensitive ion channel family protein [Sphingobacterium sp.]|nr:mechanosensitive ion channel family protein [Sphingobacterium sp.]
MAFKLIEVYSPVLLDRSVEERKADDKKQHKDFYFLKISTFGFLTIKEVKPKMENIGVNIEWYKLIYSFIALGILIFLRNSLIRLIKNFADKFYRFQARTFLIVRYVNYMMGFLFVICLLFIWGINFKDIGIFMSSIFAVIGIAFFAQWSILSNITSGIIMFFTFPYKIGDFIKIHEDDHSVYGYIEEIKSFHVVIKTLDNEIITFPNSLMLQRGVSILEEKNIEKYREALEKEAEE